MECQHSARQSILFLIFHKHLKSKEKLKEKIEKRWVLFWFDHNSSFDSFFQPKCEILRFLLFECNWNEPTRLDWFGLVFLQTTMSNFHWSLHIHSQWSLEMKRSLSWSKRQCCCFHFDSNFHQSKCLSWSKLFGWSQRCLKKSFWRCRSNLSRKSHTRHCKFGNRKKEHLCCCISNNSPHHKHKPKLEWMKNSFGWLWEIGWKEYIG